MIYKDEFQSDARLMFCRFLLLLTAAVATTGPDAFTQIRKTSIGLRLAPDGFSITSKALLDRGFAFEGMLNLGGFGRSYSFTSLIEYNFYLPDPSIRIYFGGGAHVGAWDRRRNSHNEFIAGITGIGGIEYLFHKKPLSLSLDFRPAVNFVTTYDFYPHNLAGLTARYYFGRKSGKR